MSGKIYRTHYTSGLSLEARRLVQRPGTPPPPLHIALGQDRLGQDRQSGSESPRCRVRPGAGRGAVHGQGTGSGGKQMWSASWLLESCLVTWGSFTDSSFRPL